MTHEQRKKKNRLTKNIIILLLVILFILGLDSLNLVPEKLAESFQRGQYILSTMLPPTLDEPVNVMGAAIESIQVAVLGTLYGILFSLILAVFAARNLTPHISISYMIKAFAGFVRAVPSLIWAILFIIAVGLGPTPGIMAIAVNSIGMLAKNYAETIEEMDMGVIEAIRATGGTRTHIILQGVIPSILNAFVSWSLFRFDINIRYATVLGIVGAGGIGFELVKASRVADYAQVLGVTLVIFLIIVSLEFITRFLRSKFDQIQSTI